MDRSNPSKTPLVISKSWKIKQIIYHYQYWECILNITFENDIKKRKENPENWRCNFFIYVVINKSLIPRNAHNALISIHMRIIHILKEILKPLNIYL